MPFTPLQILEVAAREAALAAARRARPLIPSRTLRAAMRVDVDSTEPGVARAVVSIPHYWAVMVHDGRGPVEARPGHKLVFFRDLANDPRVRGGFPVRVSDIRRLSKEDYDAGLRLNRDHFRAGGSFLEAPMVVVRRVGKVEGVRFFSQGLAGFLAEEGGPLIAGEFDRWVQTLVDDGLHETSSARALIG